MHSGNIILFETDGHFDFFGAEEASFADDVSVENRGK